PRAAADRMTALSPGLPDASRASAQSLIDDARAKAGAIDARTGGVAGERGVGDLVEGFAELCAGLVKNKKTDDAHVAAVEELRDVVTALCGAPGKLDDDLELLQRGIAATKAVRELRYAKEPAVELDAGFSALRTAVLDQALRDVTAKHATTTTAFAAAVREVNADLRGAIDSFVHYDPLDANEKRTQSELARAVRDAVTKAN